METVEYKNISFTVWDVGGQDKVRPPPPFPPAVAVQALAALASPVPSPRRPSFCETFKTDINSPFSRSRRSAPSGGTTSKTRRG